MDTSDLFNFLFGFGIRCGRSQIAVNSSNAKNIRTNKSLEESKQHINALLQNSGLSESSSDAVSSNAKTKLFISNADLFFCDANATIFDAISNRFDFLLGYNMSASNINCEENLCCNNNHKNSFYFETLLKS